MTDQEWLKFYIDLIILQYQTDKNRELFKAILSPLILYDVIDDVKNGYNLDTAVGKQLDILGEYIGARREAFKQVIYDNKFCLIDNSQDLSTIDDSYIGMIDYNDNIENYKNMNMLEYADYFKNVRELNDDDYRILLKIKNFKNWSTSSTEDLDNLMQMLFGDEWQLTDNYESMNMILFVTARFSRVAEIIRELKLLPSGTGQSIIISETPLVFSFFSCVDYNDDLNNLDNHAVGFVDYNDDLETKEGVMLEYGRNI